MSLFIPTNVGVHDEPGRIRTHDLLIRSSYFRENNICRWHVISVAEGCCFKSALRLSALKLLCLCAESIGVGI